jgi:RHS repeat-associated protein
LDADGAGGSGDIQRSIYAYDGDQVALQFDKTYANGAASDLTAADLSHRYLWNPQSVDQLFADEQVHYDSGEGKFVTDRLLWALTVHENSVRDLATYNSGTDVTTVANHRIFDSFGNLKSETNAAVDCLFGYTGRQLDKATGLQNNLNRWYDAKVGRWASRDPIGFNAGQMNLYCYCGNGPTNATDPRGEFAFVPAIAGGVIAGGGYLAERMMTGQCITVGGFVGAVAGGAIAGAIIGAAAVGAPVGAAIAWMGLGGMVGAFVGSMAQQGLDGGFGSVSLGTAAQAGLVGAGAGVAAGAGIALAGLAAGVGLSGGGAALATGGSIAGGATISGVAQGAAVVGGFAAGSGVNYAQGNGGNRSRGSSHGDNDVPQEAGKNTPKIDDITKNEGKLKNAMKEGDADAIHDAHRSNEGFQKRQNQRRIEERRFRRGEDLE